MDRIELVPDLPERLRRQADNVETDGWLKAAWLMRHAADELEFNRKPPTDPK